MLHTQKEETIAAKKIEAAEIARAINTIKKNSGNADIERIFLLGFFRGVEFKTEAEIIVSAK